MEKVSDHYDAVAETYFEQYQRENLFKLDEYPANYFRLQIFVQRLAQLGLESVYEVGVGEGTPLATMAKMGFRVAGCDISENMVYQARNTFQKIGFPPELIQWGDIEDSTTLASQLGKGRFDSVIAAGVLPHVKKDDLVLKNISMLVRPGGRVFVEFRNKLFSMFTFNRYTAEFILDDLLKDVSKGVREAVAKDLEKRLAMDVPPVRSKNVDGTPGYDAILAKFHNPFELVDTFKRCGFKEPVIHWYHYHPAPPMLEGIVGAEFRRDAADLEHEGTWRGYFLCSAGVVEAERL